MYSIKEASKLANLPASTIRYYDRQGLLPFVERTESGYRSFSERDMELLGLIHCLKETGLSIREIRQFTQWLQQGDETLEDRYAMFLERRNALQLQMTLLQERMQMIERKCRFYQSALEKRRAGEACGEM